MMRVTTRRNHLAKLLGMQVLQTSWVAVATAPLLGIPGPSGEVIGLDYLTAHRGAHHRRHMREP
jgi:hypothetical protein